MTTCGQYKVITFSVPAARRNLVLLIMNRGWIGGPLTQQMWCCHWIGSHGPSGVLCTMTTQLQHTVSLLRGNRTEDESFRLILQKYYIIQGQERICKCPYNLIFLPPLPYFRWSDDPKKDFPSNRGTDWSSLWTWDSLWKGFNLAQHVLGFRGKKNCVSSSSSSPAWHGPW